MNIRNWPMDKILQLPDCCFGRRWPILLAGVGVALADSFAISPEELPDKFVVWSVYCGVPSALADVEHFQIRLGKRMPANWADFAANELLFLYIAEGNITSEWLHLGTNPNFYYHNLKMPVEGKDRRFIIGIEANNFVDMVLSICIVVSAIPREVPDWLNLEKASYP